MQKLYSDFIGLPVFDEYSSSPLALVQDIILDSESGKLLAFKVKHNKIIVPLDVLRISKGLFIPDRSHILPIHEVLRVQTVAKLGIVLIGARVISQVTKNYLGKVVDYEINTNQMVLTAIHAAKTFFFFRFEEKIIPASNIIEIKKDSVIVKDIREARIKEKIPARSSAFA